VCLNDVLPAFLDSKAEEVDAISEKLRIYHCCPVKPGAPARDGMILNASFVDLAWCRFELDLALFGRFPKRRR
jgi:hypothetical protein